MFFLHIWDVRLAVYGLDGSVEKMEIPKNFSGFFVFLGFDRVFSTFG